MKEIWSIIPTSLVIMVLIQGLPMTNVQLYAVLSQSDYVSDGMGPKLLYSILKSGEQVDYN